MTRTMKEFKIIEVDRKEINKDYSYAESIMEEQSAEGWEVVSVTSDMSVDIRGKLLITLQRDK